MRVGSGLAALNVIDVGSERRRTCRETALLFSVAAHRDNASTQ